MFDEQVFFFKVYEIGIKCALSSSSSYNTQVGGSSINQTEEYLYTLSTIQVFFPTYLFAQTYRGRRARLTDGSHGGEVDCLQNLSLCVNARHRKGEKEMKN